MRGLRGWHRSKRPRLRDNHTMNFSKWIIPTAAVLGVVGAYQAYGWQGVAFAVTALVMWALMHFNRLVHVLKRAANRPLGYVGSAVMLNAKLKAGVNLMHVVALTKSLGEQLSAKDEQPEIYRWTDGTHSTVTCRFVNGRLSEWTLVRPTGDEAPQDGS
jgi:hypothetical protein